MKAGWQTKRLGDIVARLTNGYVGPTRNIYHKTGVAYLLARHVRNNRLAFDGKTYVSDEFNRKNRKSILKAGDVLLVQSGHIGHSAVVSEDHEGHNCHAMIVITPIERIVTGQFLSMYFNSPEMRQRFDEIRSGSTVPHLTCGAVKEMLIPLPRLSEQQRIIGILDEAFEGIATAKADAEKNLQNARELFESHLHSIFSQRGEEWEERPLGEICTRITKGSSPKWQGISYVEKPGILFVTSENVGEFELLIGTPKYVEERFNLKDSKSILRKGDVLSNLVGASIGRTAVYTLDDIANVNQAVCVISCNPSVLFNSFLTYLLNSPIFKQVLHDNEVDNARANISLGFFRQLSVPLPPLNEQRKIVSKLDDIRAETQRLASLYQQKLAALDELKKSLLRQAFAGKF